MCSTVLLATISKRGSRSAAAIAGAARASAATDRMAALALMPTTLRSLPASRDGEFPSAIPTVRAGVALCTARDPQCTASWIRVAPQRLSEWRICGALG
jgi:hypothetical protein